jgi:predicted ester cyclase
MKKILALTALMAFALCVTAVGNVVADEARNEAIIERNLAEIWHNKNYDVADEIVAENYVRVLAGGQLVEGREAYKKNVKDWMTICPDTYWNMDIMISKGDYVVVLYSGTGTHTGPGMGPPTGKKWTWSAVVIHRLAGGKMRECKVLGDNLSFMQQLGYKLVPPE